MAFLVGPSGSTISPANSMVAPLFFLEQATSRSNDRQPSSMVVSVSGIGWYRHVPTDVPKVVGRCQWIATHAIGHYRYKKTRNYAGLRAFSDTRKLCFGAQDRNRTGTVLPPADFKSAASTNFATRAGATGHCTQLQRQLKPCIWLPPPNSARTPSPTPQGPATNPLNGTTPRSARPLHDCSVTA